MIIRYKHLQSTQTHTYMIQYLSNYMFIKSRNNHARSTFKNKSYKDHKRTTRTVTETLSDIFKRYTPTVASKGFGLKKKKCLYTCARAHTHKQAYIYGWVYIYLDRHGLYMCASVCVCVHTKVD